MKKQAYLIVTMIVLLTVAGVSTAKAQTSGNKQFTANIPFEFNVGNQVLPAGEYTVRCTNPTSDMKVLQLRSNDGHATVLVRTNSVIGKTLTDARLVFSNYSGHYFFTQAWLAAENIGMQVPRSRNEKRLALELARSGQSKEPVTTIAVKR